MTQSDSFERQRVAKALQSHMEQHHNIVLNSSAWDRAADAVLAVLCRADRPMDEWHDKTVPAPKGVPVLAEYHEWNLASHPAKQHVVWCIDREWHRYPSTDDLAYVTRWKHLPTTALRTGSQV